MPAPLTYPGVYIEELPSTVHTITGVPTSVTAFVGRTWKGPVDEPVQINSYADFERSFGGLWRASTVGHAVQHFFANGGSQALVVRVATRGGGSAAAAATIDLGGGNTLRAANVGTWGRNLVVTVDHHTKDENDAIPDTNLFNLTVLDDPDKKLDSDKRGGSGARESFRNVSRDIASPRFVTKILEQQSNLVRVTGVGAARPAPAAVAAGAVSGNDGTDLVANDLVGAANDAAKTGIYALRKADLFNLLCIPPLTPATPDNGIAPVWSDGAKFCKDRRALLLVDGPATWTVATAAAGISAFSAVERSYAALYFPRVRIPDPLQDNNLADFAPCGVVAGIMSRTDAERGVWKAPAGIEAGLRGVLGQSINGTPGTLTDAENGTLNPLGINCLRSLPNIGHVVWGARTLDGADALASQWKYVPVRRLALYIEESLFRGTQWVVFEPNDDKLWARVIDTIRLFLRSQWRLGALFGRTEQEAFFITCDRTTMTQDDILNGRLICEIGIAPVRPAEFVVFRIFQNTAEAQR